MDFREERLDKIKTLYEGPWERKASRPEVDRWLANFTGQSCAEDVETLHALHLLSVFTYFGDRELRVLLRAMYRDLYKYPIVHAIRQSLGGSTDVVEIEKRFVQELRATRFIGIGNPSESGTHLLYYFRQENELRRGLFINTHEVFKGRVMTGSPVFEDPTVRRYVFIDDFCGSGTQAKQYSSKIVETIKDAASAASVNVTTAYFVLAATDTGIDEVRSSTKFDEVETVFELDGTHKAFAPDTRYFPADLTEVSRSVGKSMAETYGSTIVPSHPLGYKDGQLLLGFHHNVPDNSLPVFWFSDVSSPWYPIFRRYPKVGG